MTSRNRRSLPKVDYAVLNSGKMAKRGKKATQEIQDKLDYDESDLVDIHGEEDLLGEILHNSKIESLEDGKCETDEEVDPFRQKSTSV